MDDIKITADEMEIPASLRREPVVAEKIIDAPRGSSAAVDMIEDHSIEIERQFLTIEEEGGIPVQTGAE